MKDASFLCEGTGQPHVQFMYPRAVPAVVPIPSGVRQWSLNLDTVERAVLLSSPSSCLQLQTLFHRQCIVAFIVGQCSARKTGRDSSQ